MCEFHESTCNGFGDIWWTDNPIYFSIIDCRDFRERPLWICNNVVLGNHFHSANLPEGSNIISGITKTPIPFRLIDGNYISAEIATCLQTSAVQNFRPVPN